MFPHLQLSSDTCLDVLQQIWLPKTMHLEARDLTQKACQVLFRSFERTGSQAVRALVTMDLRNTKVDNAESLLKVVTCCNQLHTLQLGRTRLRDSGASILTNGLARNPFSGHGYPHQGLRLLALEENCLTSLAAAGIATMLRWTPLEVLLVARNELGDDGIKVIANGLGNDGDSRLIRLDISENHVSASGLTALLSAIGRHSKLRSLDAGGNEHIGGDLASKPECRTEVVAVLSSAESLTDLHLWRCGLADVACSMVVNAQPPGLMLLNLAANPVSGPFRNRLLRSSECGLGREILM